jgi:hypothetical protein
MVVDVARSRYYGVQARDLQARRHGIDMKALSPFLVPLVLSEAGEGRAGGVLS